MTDRSAPQALVPIPSQTVGPFFHFCLTPDTTHGRLFPDRGSRIRLAIHVTDGAGEPVTDAAVEIWQACDEAGGDSAFGRLATGADGTCEFDTVRPLQSAPMAARRTSTCACSPGDCCARCIRGSTSQETRRSATIRYSRSFRRTADRRCSPARIPPRADRWIFHLRLQGDGETVFFDV